MNIQYSLVIPCYNEAATLPSLINRLLANFTEQDNIEIILVDNGSTDHSAEILANAVQNISFLRTVHVPINQGYGYGILQGLNATKGEFLGWTHADMQTDPADAIKGFKVFETHQNPNTLFVKGKRFGRPFADTAFTIGMSCFDSLLFFLPLWDINAQPTLFSRKFYESWKNPPHDFALDLFAYASAVRAKSNVHRFPVHFGARLHGTSHWNINWKSKLKFIRRTMEFSFALRKTWRD